jgi:uncharacterized membrane protein
VTLVQPRTNSARRTYFTLNDIVLLTMLAALVFVLRVYLRIPTHIPGKSGFFWVIPIILGIGICAKPGAGTYIGVISGALTVLFGMGDNSMEFFNYLVMGLSIDVYSFMFRGHLDSVFVGMVIGAAGNLTKMIVNYYFDYVFGVPMELIIAKMGIAPITHVVAAGLGGILASLVLARLYRSGVVKKYE